MMTIDVYQNRRIARLAQLKRELMKSRTLDATIRTLQRALFDVESSVASILLTTAGLPPDRAYIGEIFYRGQWHAGAHPPIVDRVVWDRVQVLLGEKTYKSHELTYAGELIRCGHCGHPVTGESVIKPETGKEYNLLSLLAVHRKGHPRIRLNESKCDEQIIALLARLKQPDSVRDWFANMLRLWTQDEQQQSRSTADDIQRALRDLRTQQDRLLNLRLLGEIEADTFGRKNVELRDRIATLTLQLESAHRRATSTRTSPRKCLNFRKALQSDGSERNTRRTWRWPV